jgi:hypothetical protein
MPKDGHRAKKEQQQAEAHSEAPEHLPLALVSESEIEQGDAGAVQRVQYDHTEQSNLKQLEERMAKGGHSLIESRGALAQLVYREHVQQEIEQQEQSCDALEDHFRINLCGKSSPRFNVAIVSVRSMCLGQTDVQLN